MSLSWIRDKSITYPGLAPGTIRNNLVLLIALSSILFLPAATYFLSQTSSMAAGVMAASLLIVGLRCAGVPAIRGHSLPSLEVLVSVSVVFLLSTHLTIRAYANEIDTYKAITSLVLLATMIFACSTTAYIARRASDGAVSSAVMWITAIFLFAGTMSILGVQPSSSTATWKSVFPFTEPSHFASALTPVLAFAVVTTNRLGRWIWILVGFALGYFLQSLTMVVGSLLVAAICLTPAQLAIFGAGTAAALPFLDLSYFASRLDFDNSQTTNLSSLVYVQGWELIQASAKQTWGWGVGFQQLGFTFLDAPTSRIISNLTGGTDLNLSEGSFVAAKLVSELGIFGFSLVGLHTYFASRAFFALRRTALAGVYRPFCEILAMCSLFTYMVEMFVRGTGYFSAPAMLMLSSVFIMMRSHWLASSVINLKTRIIDDDAARQSTS